MAVSLPQNTLSMFHSRNPSRYLCREFDVTDWSKFRHLGEKISELYFGKILKEDFFNQN
jgi:hypothetical protein